MNENEKNEVLREVVRQAMASQPDREEPHPMDDEDLLLRWSTGEINVEEHSATIDHLADCPNCSKKLAAMIRAGALILPDLAKDAAEPEVGMSELNRSGHDAGADRPAIPARSTLRQTDYSARSMTWGRLALAASLLVAIGGVWWLLSDRGPGKMLAQAEFDLQSGDVVGAMQQAEGVLDGKLDPETTTRAKDVLRRAGSRAAESELADGNFKHVLAIEHRVAGRAGTSGRLLSLRLQAERGIPSPSALTATGRLVDYGYELDGTSPRKSLPTLDKTTQRLDEEFQAAVTAFPNDLDLLLNRGQFLLSLSRYEDARECFVKTVAVDADSPLARLGLGLVAFELQSIDEALRQFDAAIKLAPENVAANLNAGICLLRLNRPIEAAARFQRALELTSDVGLRQRIEDELSAIGELGRQSPSGGTRSAAPPTGS